MVTMKEESNIYIGVEDEMKKVSAEYDSVKNKVDEIKAVDGTVSKELKKQKYEKVVMA